MSFLKLWFWRIVSSMLPRTTTMNQVCHEWFTVLVQNVCTTWTECKVVFCVATVTGTVCGLRRWTLCHQHGWFLSMGKCLWETTWVCSHHPSSPMTATAPLGPHSGDRWMDHRSPHGRLDDFGWLRWTHVQPIFRLNLFNILWLC